MGREFKWHFNFHSLPSNHIKVLFRFDLKKMKREKCVQDVHEGWKSLKTSYNDRMKNRRTKRQFCMCSHYSAHSWIDYISKEALNYSRLSTLIVQPTSIIYCWRYFKKKAVGANWYVWYFLRGGRFLGVEILRLKKLSFKLKILKILPKDK